jgi:hypothetical protein
MTPDNDKPATPSKVSEASDNNGELKKIIGYIKRNAEKINEHTWNVYKEQILGHIEDAEYFMLPTPVDAEGKKDKEIIELKQSILSGLKIEVEKDKQIALLTSLMKSGEQRGVEKGLEESRQEIARLKGLIETAYIEGWRDESTSSRCDKLREAASELLHLHLCEQEGLSSGQPTREQWFTAVDKLSAALTSSGKENEIV